MSKYSTPRNLTADCLAHTARKYPDGYGFALTYLDGTLNPAWLRDGAMQVCSRSLGNAYPLDRKDADLARFVAAYAAAQQFEDWAIEAAQVLVQAGLTGDAEAARVLKLCGHPGY